MARAALAALLALPSAAGLAGTTGRAGVEETEPHGPHPRRLDDAANPYVCADGAKGAAEQWKVHGTNLGGWLVLEPWITPSLFYQFLGADLKWGSNAAAHTGMDSYTFCKVLGPVEGNRQMRRHWQTWLREVDIAAIAATGATHVRIPVGDWQYVPYGPYIGCMDGANDELDRALALCQKVRRSPPGLAPCCRTGAHAPVPPTPTLAPLLPHAVRTEGAA